MVIGFFLRTSAAVGLTFSSVAALAQSGWTPASEVVGQPIQVTTNGVTNGGPATVETITGSSAADTAVAEPAQAQPDPSHP